MGRLIFECGIKKSSPPEAVDLAEALTEEALEKLILNPEPSSVLILPVSIQHIWNGRWPSQAVFSWEGLMKTPSGRSHIKRQSVVNKENKRRTREL